jgi:hypothetical protein
VLADIAAVIRVAETLGEDSRPYLDRYQSVQRALGLAVKGGPRKSAIDSGGDA